MLENNKSLKMLLDIISSEFDVNLEKSGKCVKGYVS